MMTGCRSWAKTAAMQTVTSWRSRSGTSRGFRGDGNIRLGAIIQPPQPGAYQLGTRSAISPSQAECWPGLTSGPILSGRVDWPLSRAQLYVREGTDEEVSSD